MYLYFFRVNSRELDTLSDQLHRPIDIAQSLTLPQPLHDRFVDAFLVEVDKNRRIFYPDKEVILFGNTNI